jgi:LAO/AO transport system kinase
VVLASSTTGDGLADVWAKVLEHVRFVGDGLEQRRARQAERWLWTSVETELLRRLHDDDAVKARLPDLLAAVQQQRVSPGRAALDLVDAFLGRAR